MSTTPPAQKPSTDSSVNFLHRLYPEGPWCLVALEPDGSPKAATFFPSTEAECRRWIERHVDTHNLYYQVNPVREPMDRKPGDIDIREVCYLVADIDAKAHVDTMPLDQQLKMIDDRIRAKLKVDPTCLLATGGGRQLLLKITPTTDFDATRAACAAVAKLLDGDSVGDPSRMLRLPGTRNLPNKKKRALGRTASLVGDALWFDTEWNLGDFHEVQPSSLPAKPTTIEARRINSVDDLGEWGVPDRVKVIIVQGLHPDEPKDGDNSRSAWLFDAVCNLMRAGVPDDVIYGIITDPKFGISESVLEKGRQAHRYATKQLTSAKEWIEEPWLAKLNSRYFCVTVAGRFLIGEYKMDFIGTNIRTKEPVYRRTLHFIRPEEFCKVYENISIEVGTNAKGTPIKKKLGDWWRGHPMRRQYGSLVMRPDIDEELVQVPGQDLPDLNLWQGFQVAPMPGDRHLSFKAMVHDLACKGDAAKFNYLWKWMAFKVQHPALRMNVAPVMYGLKGIGKTFVWRYYGEKLFGQHCIITANPDLIAGKFNAPLRDCLLLISDEAIVPKEARAISTVKVRITGDEIPIERKGIDIENVPNMMGIAFLSNERHVIPATKDERRFFAAEFSGQRRGDRPYFAAIAADLEDHGGLSHLLHDLLTTDLTGFDPHAYPMTEELADQVALTTMTATRECVAAALVGLDNACFQTRDIMAVLGRDHKEEVIKQALFDEGWHYGSRKPTKMVADGERSLEPSSYWHRKGDRSYRVIAEPRGDAHALVYEDKEYREFLTALWTWEANYRAQVMRRESAQITVELDVSGCPVIQKVER